MNTITKAQIESLIQSIYNSLIQMEGMGMGEMGECRDEATRIVNEWMEANNITEA